MRRYRMPLVIGAILGCLPTLAWAQASISVGDEVVFTGGPGQKPRSIQTGFTVETGSMRLSGPDQGEEKKRGGRAGKAGAGASGSDSGSTVTLGDAGISRNVPDPGSPAEVAAARATVETPPDLSALPTDELLTRVGDASPVARMGVANALAERTKPVDRPAARRSLEELLADPDPRVTRSSLDALAKFGDPTAGPLAMKLVYDTNDQTAIAAIRAVESLGYRAAIPELTKLADRDMGPVGQAARKAAGELSKPPLPTPSAAPQLTPGHP